MKFWKLFKRFYEKAAEKMVFEIKDFIKENEKILDLGCGSGIFGKKLKEKLKVNVLGIDVEDQRIVNFPFLKFDGKKIPFKDNFFDTVLISFVLHHVQNPISLLKEAKRVSKKIIIFEDLPEGIFGKIRCFFHFLFSNLIFESSEKFNFFKEREWEKIFKDLNFKILAKKDFFPPFWFLDPIKKKIFVLEKIEV